MNPRLFIFRLQPSSFILETVPFNLLDSLQLVKRKRTRGVQGGVPRTVLSIDPQGFEVVECLSQQLPELKGSVVGWISKTFKVWKGVPARHYDSRGTLPWIFSILRSSLVIDRGAKRFNLPGNRFYVIELYNVDPLLILQFTVEPHHERGYELGKARMRSNKCVLIRFRVTKTVSLGDLLAGHLQVMQGMALLSFAFSK